MSITDLLMNTRFCSAYYRNMEKWKDDLLSHDGLTLAIARKGPRMLEMLVQIGLLSRDDLDSVICETALPFLQNLPGNFKIVDDTIIFGSSFVKIANSVFRTFDNAGIFSGGFYALPFSVAQECCLDYVLEHITGSPNIIQKDDCNSFVMAETNALRLLNKPLLCCQPIVNAQLPKTRRTHDYVSKALREIHSSHLVRDIVHGTEWIAIGEDSSKDVHTWSLDLAPDLFGMEDDNNPLVRIRIYLTDKGISVVPVLHTSYRNDKTRPWLINNLPFGLGSILDEVRTSAHKASSHAFQVIASAADAVWCNYLASLVPFLTIKPALEKAFDSLQWEGIDSYDLRLLIGPDHVPPGRRNAGVLHELNQIVCSPRQVPPSQRICLSSDKNDEAEIVQDQIIPFAYHADYKTNLRHWCQPEDCKTDFLDLHFFAQHCSIELPSRKHGKYEPETRLTFGETWRYYFERYNLKTKPEKELVLKRLLDYEFDSGAAVPHYIRVEIGKNPERLVGNAASYEDSELYVRTFRSGEGQLVIIRILTAVLILRNAFVKFAKNSDEIKKDFIRFIGRFFIATKARRSTPFCEAFPQLKSFIGDKNAGDGKDVIARLMETDECDKSSVDSDLAAELVGYAEQRLGRLFGPLSDLEKESLQQFMVDHSPWGNEISQIIDQKCEHSLEWA